MRAIRYPGGSRRGRRGVDRVGIVPHPARTAEEGGAIGTAGSGRRGWVAVGPGVGPVGGWGVDGGVVGWWSPCEKRGSEEPTPMVGLECDAASPVPDDGQAADARPAPPDPGA
jgi:hypothetical protein